MIPKKFLTHISYDQFAQFQEVIKGETKDADDFLGKFVGSHGVGSIEDALSLFLMRAIRIGDALVVSYITSRSNNGGILVNIDNAGSSAICEAIRFEDEDILDALGKYITQNSASITKVNLTDDASAGELSVMSYILSMARQKATFLEHYIKPLYDDVSVEAIVKDIGGSDEVYDVNY